MLMIFRTLFLKLFQEKNSLLLYLLLRIKKRNVYFKKIFNIVYILRTKKD